MGNSSSTPVPPSSAPVARSPPVNSNSEELCPVKQTNNLPSSSECPVKGNKSSTEKYKNPNQYNVYSQKIDPKNNMPVNANQDMAPNQTVPLDTTRVKSNIPKGGTDDDSWSYPSPQMYVNF